MRLDHKGLTLLELIAAMALLALAALMVVPRLEPVLDRIRLQSDAREMAAVLRTVRQDAIITGKPATVCFYPFASLYRISGGETLRLRPGVKMLGSTFGKAYPGGPQACTFYPNGAPEPQAGTVILQNNRGEKQYIIVNPVVGRVRISDEPPGGWDY